VSVVAGLDFPRALNMGVEHGTSIGTWGWTKLLKKVPRSP